MIVHGEKEETSQSRRNCRHSDGAAAIERANRIRRGHRGSDTTQSANDSAKRGAVSVAVLDGRSGGRERNAGRAGWKEKVDPTLFWRSRPETFPILEKRGKGGSRPLSVAMTVCPRPLGRRGSRDPSAVGGGTALHCSDATGQPGALQIIRGPPLETCSEKTPVSSSAVRPHPPARVMRGFVYYAFPPALLRSLPPSLPRPSLFSRGRNHLTLMRQVAVLTVWGET